MTYLRRILAAAVLTVSLATVGLAGDNGNLPCSPPAPGQTETMPCTGTEAAADDSADPGQIQTQPTAFEVASFVEETLIAFLLF